MDAPGEPAPLATPGAQSSSRSCCRSSRVRSGLSLGRWRRRGRPDLFDDGAIPLRAAVGGEVEYLVLALAAEIEIGFGEDQLVAEGRGLRPDEAVRVDDQRTADQSRP